MWSISQTSSESTITIKQPWYDEKFEEYKMNMTSEKEAAPLIKDMPWADTHRQWNSEYNVWTLDLAGLFIAIDHMSDEYDVTVTTDVLEAYQEMLHESTDKGDMQSVVDYTTESATADDEQGEKPTIGTAGI